MGKEEHGSQTPVFTIRLMSCCALLSELGQNLQTQHLERVQAFSQIMGGFLSDDSLDCLSCFGRILC